MPEYGRDEDLWDRLTESDLTFLLEHANDALTHRTGMPTFDFARGFLL